MKTIKEIIQEVAKEKGVTENFVYEAISIYGE